MYSAISSSEELGKITSIRGKRPGKKKEETVKPTCFRLLYVESDFGTQTPQTNHSQYSSPVEALNLIVDSQIRVIKNVSFSLLLVTFSIKANF